MNNYKTLKPCTYSTVLCDDPFPNLNGGHGCVLEYKPIPIKDWVGYNSLGTIGSEISSQDTF